MSKFDFMDQGVVDVPVVKHKELLTSREIEVAKLVSLGKSNKEMANLLSISIKTVEKHRQSCLSKLCRPGETGRTSSVAIARELIKRGLLSLEDFVKG